MRLRRLEPTFHERIWGATKLDPWFPNVREKAGPFPIGEVWFETGEVPLLVKFLFTTEKLSVQVHPDDAYAQFHHSSPGKTEMWHVIAAEPGAQVAAGFRETVTAEQVRAAALSGEIDNLLQWHEARPGDTFFIPAGTVHAIGAGLTICEIQQPSDITYRLYDYGRGRELHLDSGLAVSHFAPHTFQVPPPQTNPMVELVRCKHFTNELFTVSGKSYRLGAETAQLLTLVGGHGELAGQAAAAGQVWLSEPDGSGYEIEITGDIRLLRSAVPSRV